MKEITEFLTNNIFIVLGVYIVGILGASIKYNIMMKKTIEPKDRKKLKNKYKYIFMFIAYSYILITVLLGKLYIAIALLSIEALINLSINASLRKQLNFYESKEYDDWIRNVKGKEDNE